MKIVYWIALVLTVVGAVNWGLVGLFGFDWDLVAKILGDESTLARIVYVIVGISGLWVLAATALKMDE